MTFEPRRITLAYVALQTPATHPPLQQSWFCRQLSPRRRHWHRPSTQFIVPQHSTEARHAPPAGVQHCTLPVLARVKQSNSPQHWIDDVHIVSPCGRHVLGKVQIPVSQIIPAQQSLAATHELPGARQVQTWRVLPSQSICPQQSLLLVQVVPAR